MLELQTAMESTERKYWVAFSRVPGIGRARYEMLERHFGSLQSAWAAGESELQRAGLDQRAARAVVTKRDAIDPDGEAAALDNIGVQAITGHDGDYPDRLKQTYDLPPVLYVRGRLTPEDERSVTVVGTRRPSAYGREAAHRLSFDLARADVAIVSGLARGIDAIAHRAALEAGQRTIAVLGSGVDVIYPREHARLADEIASNGAVVSEHPLGTRPKAENFPRRNRIMSGISLGTLVIEAGRASGALITARFALEQGREVFATPGSIFNPNSAGTNSLIKRSGAKLVSDYNDVLEELNLSSVGAQLELKALFPADDQEAEVLRYVTFDPIHIDEVIRASGLAISHVSGILAMMELKGLVRQVGGMHFLRVKETSEEYQPAS